MDGQDEQDKPGRNNKKVKATKDTKGTKMGKPRLLHMEGQDNPPTSLHPFSD